MNRIFKVFDRGSWKDAKKCVFCNKVFTDRKRFSDFSKVKFCSRKCRYNSKVTD